jgi:small subunit ribosomal protein S5
MAGPRHSVSEEDREAARMDLSRWVPRTDLGRKVKNGEITSLHDVIALSIPIKEVEVVDKLITEMSEEIINVGRVQRVTDSGRRMRFRVVMAVGNKNGYVGVGEATGKEAGPTIRKAIARAKMNIKEVKRGCGSWECACKTPHTVPFKVTGAEGSVRVSLSPAPKGTGLVSGEIAKKILSLAGMKDVWVHTEGHPRTSINFAHAVVDALVNTNAVRIDKEAVASLGIVEGMSAVKEDGKAEQAQQ